MAYATKYSPQINVRILLFHWFYAYIWFHSAIQSMSIDAKFFSSFFSILPSSCINMSFVQWNSQTNCAWHVYLRAIKFWGRKNHIKIWMNGVKFMLKSNGYIIFEFCSQFDSMYFKIKRRVGDWMMKNSYEIFHWIPFQTRFSKYDQKKLLFLLAKS